MSERGIQILSHLQGQRDRFLEVLKTLVEIESPSGNAPALKEVMETIANLFSTIGYESIFYPGSSSGGQVLIRPEQRANRSYQLLIGHCDTVWPIGTLEEMPFEVDGNEVKGPGCYDMKSGLCMIYFALKSLSELDLDPTLTPAVFINSDEEVGSIESEHRIRLLARKACRSYILEPALDRDGKIKTERKGVGHFEIRMKGRPAHSGLAPEEGASAILGLSQIIHKLYELNDPLKGITINVGTIEGGERSNVVAAKSKATVDVRVKNMDDAAYIEEAIYNLKSELEGVDLAIEGSVGRPPLVKNQRNEKLWHLARETGRELDLDLEEGLSGGASDGNITSQYTATLDGLGAVGEGAHAYHEKIFLDETIERCA
ncbi:MAG: M20 family metallopeptidase, partial [Balneolaceae bacterium]|nr:M20 family metallopeptidase [Balneolaceae bacterium]